MTAPLDATQHDPLEEARALLREDAEARARACGAELDALLKRHNCELAAFVTIGAERVPIPVLLVGK